MGIEAARAALRPALSDVVLLAVAGWLVLWTAAGGTNGLLSDAGTGVHLRTGEAILERGAPPQADWFSFTKPGEPWYAWEWLADAAMALVHRICGLGGVSVAFAALWGFNVLLMLRRALDRGANAMIALALVPLAAGAASVHFLARPHGLTVTFLLLALGWVEDRGRVWLLVPLAALWANVHGGFAALFALLLTQAAGSWLERGRQRALLMAKVLAACGCASLINPYGWRLHGHMAVYLASGWLRELVEEFRAPRPDMPSWPYFVILLWSGVLLGGWLAMWGRWRDAMLVLLWAYASMTSIRHLAVYALVLIPLLAGAVSGWARLPRVVAELGRDHLAGLRRTSIWPAAAMLACLGWTAADPWRFAFPAARYPSDAVERYADVLDGARVFSTDAWSDYLIWRFEGRTKVAVDGRSDFYGEAFSREYLNAVNGRPGWDRTLARWRPDAILIPEASPLNELLARDGAWAKAGSGGGAALYLRR